MAKILTSKIRTSSTLMILAKDKTASTNQVDFKALLLKRPAEGAFANSAVFPGGVFNVADETPSWRKHFERMGVKRHQLQSLVEVRGKRPDIFRKENPEDIEREICLRITALRETFEELGILFCRDRKCLAEGSGEGYGNFKENFDRKHWQKLVHTDATQFLSLCEELDIVPDLWSMYEWSNWITPSNFGKRFNTAFYLMPLKTVPDVIANASEVSEFGWKTPAEYLRSHFKDEIWLPPPQVYELSRLLNLRKVEDLKNFAQQRSSAGSEVTLCVEFKCKDASVYPCPGDDMYPCDPFAPPDKVPINKTAKELREGVKNIHRFEFYGLSDVVLHINIKPAHGHLAPINANPKKHD